MALTQLVTAEDVDLCYRLGQHGEFFVILDWKQFIGAKLEIRRIFGEKKCGVGLVIYEASWLMVFAGTKCRVFAFRSIFYVEYYFW